MTAALRELARLFRTLRLPGLPHVSREHLTLPVTLGLLFAGAVLVGAALWGAAGWEAAVGFWGACLLAAGLSEAFG